MTTTAALAITSPVERAMALDLLDEAPITHLTEDENPWFASSEPIPFAVDGEADWADEVLRDQMEGF